MRHMKGPFFAVGMLASAHSDWLKISETTRFQSWEHRGSAFRVCCQMLYWRLQSESRSSGRNREILFRSAMAAGRSRSLYVLAVVCERKDLWVVSWLVATLQMIQVGSCAFLGVAAQPRVWTEGSQNHQREEPRRTRKIIQLWGIRELSREQPNTMSVGTTTQQDGQSG